MRVFFLAPIYRGLYKPILDEFRKQGYEVYMEPDIALPKDPNRKAERIVLRKIKKYYRSFFHTEENYWRHKIKNSAIYECRYDIFLCIDGISFHPYLLKHFKDKNPLIKSILYLWDTNKYYDFFRYKQCFDRILTFDIEDAESEAGVGVLHSYWVPSQPRKNKYKLLMVGSDHDDRIKITSKIYQQLKDVGLPSFIKIIINKPPKRSFFNRMTSLCSMNSLDESCRYEQKKILPFTSLDSIPADKMLQLIDESECILDTDKPIQTGATQRVIWALARGKKIISTNVSLKRMSFYNSNQIKFIDRKNPVIDIEFLIKEEQYQVSEDIQILRIDKWIHQLIDFD